MDVEKYRKLFLEECREHLQGMNSELLRLEAQGEGFDGIDTLFREAHSIKGMSGSMGYDPMVALSHAMEDILDGIRKGTLPVTPDLVSLLFEGVDCLGQLADEVEEAGRPAMDVGDLTGRLRASAREGGPAAAAPAVVELSLDDEVEAEGGDEKQGEEDGAIRLDERGLPGGGDLETGDEEPYRPGPEEKTRLHEMARQGQNAYLCLVSVSRDTASVTARNFVVLGRLNKAGTIVRSRPSLAEVVGGKGEPTMEIVVSSVKSADELSGILHGVPELTAVQVRRLALDAPVEAKEQEVPPAGETVSGTSPDGRPSRRDASQTLIEKHLPGRATTVRVDTRVLDELINIVGELIISRDSLLQVARTIEDEALHRSLDRLDFMVRGFRDTIMAVRMMPLEVITDRLPRIVRDLSHKWGKQISFEILGQGIELDRAILEELGDVLVHLVRNAIDHGVESIEDRRAAGKPPKATVRIVAGREQDWVWISVEDDGRGMVPEDIFRTAAEKGLIDPSAGEGMGRQEMLMLVCLPGLSTAGKVSDISGRGVGMDVVKSKVESFGGSLQIDSTPGKGTVTTLRLPLTLAIVHILLVEAGGQLFAIPVSHVTHALKIRRGEIARSQGRDMVRWGKKVVPLGFLNDLVGLPRGALPVNGEVPVVVAEMEGRPVAMAVDRLAGTFEAVIKPLGLPLKRVPGLAGATVMGDGRTVLVLDVKALASRAEGRDPSGGPGEASR